MPHCDPVQPDLLVLRKEDLGALRERRIYGVPALIVEVVPPSNAEQDTQVKRHAYARAGVPEYWIVRPSTRDLLVCSQPDHDLGDYTHVELTPTGGTLTSPTLPISTPIAGFFEGHPDIAL
jgi:Uma2 family endonuclease